MGWIKKMVTTTSILLLVIAGTVYGGGYWYFQKHFLPGTTLSGLDVSYRTVKETEALINKKILSHTLAVDTRNGGREKLEADQLGMAYQPTGEVQRIMEYQPSWKWFIYSDHQDIVLSGGIKVDQTKLCEAVKNLRCASNMKAPVDARILKINGKYQVVPEVNGTQLDLEQVRGVIETALKRGDASVSLELCYKNPTIKEDDPQLQQACQTLNIMQETIITYDFDDRSEYLDKDGINRWIEDNRLSMDQVKKYVKKLAAKYDTRGEKRSFITYDNREVEIVGGDYGWEIDVDQEADKLYGLITSGTTEVRKPIYAHKALSRKRNDIGFSYLEIDTVASKLVLYIDGNPIAEDSVMLYGSIPGGCNELISRSKTGLDGKSYSFDISRGIEVYGISPQKETLMKLQGENGILSLGNRKNAVCTISETTARTIFETIPDQCPVIVY